MYRQVNNILGGAQTCINRLTDNACIPFAPDNTDYQTFKRDLAEGVELQDPDGNVIDGIAFLESLP